MYYKTAGDQIAGLHFKVKLLHHIMVYFGDENHDSWTMFSCIPFIFLKAMEFNILTLEQIAMVIFHLPAS